MEVTHIDKAWLLLQKPCVEKKKKKSKDTKQNSAFIL